MKSLQRQLKRLLMVLMLVTCLNAVFLWQTLNQLFNSYGEVVKIQKTIAMAADLESGILEENKFRDVDSESPSRKKLLEIRNQIRTHLKELRDMVTDRHAISLLRDIQRSWKSAHDEQASNQTLIYIRSFISGQQQLLKAQDTATHESTRATTTFVGAYLAIFGIVFFVLNNYLSRRMFQPLSRLSDKMKHFQAGNHTLIAVAHSKDEVGHLESQFYDLAKRIGQTVNDLKELDRVKTDFISIASHELRTPMTSVKGSLSLILSGSVSTVSPDVKELLTIAEKETDRLIRLINDILDLTKMETKKLPMDKKWYSVDEIILNAVKGIGGLLEVTKVKIEIAKPDDQWRAFIDRDRIQQVVTNLLSNAVKFSPTLGVVTIGYEAHDKGVVVTVSDKGPGIKPEDQEHVFEKFRSTDSGKSKIIRGTGLGLPICKAIVEQHGGRIGLQSEYGNGSMFYFTMPEAMPVHGLQSRSDQAA